VQVVRTDTWLVRGIKNVAALSLGIFSNWRGVAIWYVAWGFSGLYALGADQARIPLRLASAAGFVVLSGMAITASYHSIAGARVAKHQKHRRP
jgi:hypothetical protein